MECMSAARRRGCPRAGVFAAMALLLALPPFAAPSPPLAAPSPPCPPRSLAAYSVVLRTFWTRDLFPKHYPEWRPAAQWSALIGRSHDASFVLFRVGAAASVGVKAFAEGGRATEAQQEVQQGAGGVLDVFGAAAIGAGAGLSQATFFADGNHSRVSLMARMVPSPDWFIGVDSLDLCANGNWIDNVTIQSDPLDAGTDNGLTFTSPNWETQPPGVISRLTSTFPPHPASSFFYPDLQNLPTMATFQFIKVREYEMSAGSGRTVEPPRTTPRPESDAVSESGDQKGRRRRPPKVSADARKRRKDAVRNSHRAAKCRLSQWSEWSACSKSCGIGQMRRRRVARRGSVCPPLLESKWCGSPQPCTDNYFQW